MKKLICSIIILVFIPAWAWAADFVQTKYGEAYPSTTKALTFDGPVTAGNLLIVVLRIGSDDTVTVTSGGRTFTQDSHVDHVLGDWGLSVHSLANASGGSTMITATKTGSPDVIRMSIIEYSGLATSNPTHKTVSNSATSGTGNAGSVTTTIDGCLLFCAVATDSDGLGFSVLDGYTLREFDMSPTAEPDKTAFEDKIATTAGTYSGRMSLNSDTWAAILVAYAPSGQGEGVAKPNPPLNLHLIK